MKIKCEDCLHYKVCELKRNHYYLGSPIGEIDEAETGCHNFTDSSEWVHIPCKVGDSIFCDGKLFADRYVGEVMEFTVDIVRTQVCTTHCGEIDMIFNFKDFGKIVFLTREEAEKALERTKDE